MGLSQGHGDISNADALSRLPLPRPNPAPKSEVHFFSVLEEIPLSAKEIKMETKRDKVLSKVLFYTQSAWPSHVSADTLASPYFIRRSELSVDQDCVTWGNRVIVPVALRKKMLSMLHEGHPGITPMKMLSRSHVWWPRLTQHIASSETVCYMTTVAKRGTQLPLVVVGVADAKVGKSAFGLCVSRSTVVSGACGHMYIQSGWRCL